MNLLDNTPNQQFKFGTKNCVEVNDDAHGIYNPIVKLNLKLLCESQVYVIIVIHAYLWKEL